MTLLSADGLVKRFGGVVAAKDVTFALDPGEMLAIIGPNGAGKSTTFNMVGGQLKPDAGRVTLAGQDITGIPPRAVCRMGVGRTFQVAQTFLSFSVLGNVQMALIAHHGQTRRLLADAAALHRDDALALLSRVGMAAQAARPIGELA
jgi:branched-chain amino acid transport system ATP-binding protein